MRSVLRKGSTLIEVMVVIVILTIGVVSTYNILYSGIRLADTTEDRIQAINIAREGIEAVTNIRDTNWFRLSSDPKNCFDAAWYDATCIGGANPSASKLGGNPAILLNTGNTWKLVETFTSSGVAYDGSGFLTQTSGDLLAAYPDICTSTKKASCRLQGFSRTVTIENVPAIPAATPPVSAAMNVSVTVNWQRGSDKNPHSITLKKTLTNWKPNF